MKNFTTQKIKKGLHWIKGISAAKSIFTHSFKLKIGNRQYTDMVIFTETENTNLSFHSYKKTTAEMPHGFSLEICNDNPDANTCGQIKIYLTEQQAKELKFYLKEHFNE